MRRISERGELARAQLVDDLAWLGVTLGVVAGRLQGSERAQRCAREVRQKGQRLVASDQRVAPEQRHEPGQAGRRQLDGAGVARSETERGEVGDARAPQLLQLGPVGGELRRLALPLLAAGACRRERSSESGALAAVAAAPFPERSEVELEPGRAAPGELDRDAQAAAVEAGLYGDGGRHRRTPTGAVAAVAAGFGHNRQLDPALELLAAVAQ
ncbi:hypothetical protein HRbin41_00898 [bacterium HR41]|nr:hypothetical protein HRbin41_00898 [bacterium HR41]